MKRLIRTICLLVVVFINATAQEELFYKGSQIKHYGVGEGAAAISQNPVTNREYIIYLMWMRNVFGPTYPDLFYNSIPGLNIDSLKSKIIESSGSDDINTILSCSEPFVRNYMFNPKYLDYPVVGVSWQNANNFAKWFADRCNENYLINIKFLNHVPFPSDQDYFNTDAYLAGKWMGQLRMKIATNNKEYPERDFEWHDDVLIPVFRLPSKTEAANSAKTEVNYFKAYPFGKKHFLSKWNKQFIASETDTSYVLSQSFLAEAFPREKISCNKTIQLSIAGELYLDINNQTNESNLVEIYKQNGQVSIPVESYVNDCCFEGLNPYLIIDEDENKNPIFVSGYKDLQPANYKELKVFRVACSANSEQLGIKNSKGK